MNIKLAAAVVAVVGLAALVPPAEAKPKFQNQVGNNNFAAGGCYQNNNGNNGRRLGWYKNGKANGNWGNGGWGGNNGGWGNNGGSGGWCGNNGGWGGNNGGWQGNNGGWGNNNGGWGNNNGGWGNNNGGWGGRFGSNFNVDNIQARLADRLQRGISSGRITSGEASRLQQMQDRINQLETQYRADGNLSSRERSRLGSQLNRLSDSLRREIRDRNM